MNNNGGGATAPTGCYKCGRPGHWSRDCPSDPTAAAASSDPPPNSGSGFTANPSSKPPLPSQKTTKPKPQRKTRPKLTPDLLLSDGGIGYILKYFPRAFKCRGRGHEVNDLRHLLSLYAEWHSRLLPYYNFDQFIQKVEQVGATKRVKVCLRELQQRMHDGLDPLKPKEPEAEQNLINEQDAPNDLNMPDPFQENDLQNKDVNNSQEDQGIPQGMWEETTEETCHPTDTSGVEEVTNQGFETNTAVSNQNLMSEEQKARMEANRLKALERAAARSRSSCA